MVTSTWQKIVLVLFGLVLFLVLLEVGMRVGGFVLLSSQDFRNQLSLKAKNTYKILCLGESTTQGQYPSFLQEILNQQNVGIRFSVIDKGLVGTSTTTILNRVESYLDKYRPDMVVVMMGINDLGRHIPYEKPTSSGVVLFFRSFKVYKLMRLLSLRITTCLEELGLYKNYREKVPMQEKRFVVFDSQAEEDLRRVEKDFKNALMLNSANEEAYLGLGRLYSDQDWFQQSEECFKHVLALNPGSDVAYLNLGELYQSQGQLGLAEECFRTALALKPGDDGAYVGLGQLAREQKKYREAEEFFFKALALNSANPWSYKGLGELYQDQGQFSLAKENFKRAIRLNPKSDWTYMALGNLYRIMGRFQDSEECLNHALDINSRNSEVYANLGYLYQDQGRFHVAEEFFRKALSVNPQHEESYKWLAFLCRDPNIFSQAADHLKKTRDPNSANDLAEVYGALGTIYSERDQTMVARENYEIANQIRSQQSNLTTANNYRKLKEILEKRKIRLICVQYPMRNVNLLKKMFQGDDDGVVFVDNESNFKEAVRKDSYSAYFTDMFGGDLGHCTEAGNRLLAENIADVILKEGFRK